MKRFAILLGHADGQLSTNKDLFRMEKFLKSDRGGAWYISEIHSEINISLHRLSILLNQVRNNHYDYVLLYFSGHGGYKRSTVIELNPKGETVSEQFLSGLAFRQLNIFDCCRAPLQELSEESMSAISFSNRPDSCAIRKLYDKRIMLASKQQMSLYSCSIGECSYDFGAGGIFTTHFLESTNNFFGDYLLVSQAYVASCAPTLREAQVHGKTQTPDLFMAKLPVANQLIIAVNDMPCRSNEYFNY